MPRNAVEGLGLALSVVAIVGCGVLPTRFVTGLSADERSAAAQIPIYRNKLLEGAYRSVSPVTGLSCQVSPNEHYRASEGNALEELQRATFKAGGNAVIGVSCDHFGQRQGSHNCFRSIVCRGTAVELSNGNGNGADTPSSQ